MHELWVKKTIWRRYLIKDEEIEEAKEIIILDQDSFEVEENYDQHNQMEYDEEEIFLPLEIASFVIEEQIDEA